MTRRHRLLRPLAALGSLAMTSLWPAACVAQQADAAMLFDPTRLTLQQSFGYLTTATPNAGSGSGHAATSETEISYGAADWFQFAIAVPGSLSGAGGGGPGSVGRQFSANGVALRNLFITPRADQQNVFFGLSVQVAYMAPGAALPLLANTNTRFAVGVAPIVGFHHDGYELIVSPTVAFGLGAGGAPSLAPAARLTRKLSDTVTAGIEYAGALGPIGAIVPPSQQAHIVYGVADVTLSGFKLSVGVGYGLTAASNGIAVKAGISHGF
jgi:hypothetical protein